MKRTYPGDKDCDFCVYPMFFFQKFCFHCGHPNEAFDKRAFPLEDGDFDDYVKGHCTDEGHAKIRNGAPSNFLFCPFCRLSLYGEPV